MSQGSLQQQENKMEESPAGTTRTLHSHEGQKQRRNLQTQAHLVPKCLDLCKPTPENDMELGTSPRLAEAGREKAGRGSGSKLQPHSPPALSAPCLPV